MSRSDGDKENGVFWFDAPSGIVTWTSAKEAEHVTHASGKMKNNKSLKDFNVTYVDFFYFRLAYDSYYWTSKIIVGVMIFS
jgi:hypothetical protein